MKMRRPRSRGWFGRFVATTAILAGALMWAWSFIYLAEYQIAEDILNQVKKIGLGEISLGSL